MFFGRPFVNGSPYAIRPLSVLSFLSVYLSICLSVCLYVCLSVTLVYCGQTVGRIKMKVSMQVGLGPGHTVLDGNPAPPRKGAKQPHIRNLRAQASPASI